MDEGYYMRRAMHVMEGLGAQESSFYDHPYFGQLFLAGILRLVGYPQILHPSSDLHSIESLYLVPRALMGILSVIDTFLIYKISERMYNSRNVALFGSILFAVMPSTWLTRMILLDSILLPFVLLSILLALYTTVFKEKNKSRKKTVSLILLSGVSLGLAIFTKIPAFSMIPLIGFLIYRDSNNNDDHQHHHSTGRDFKTLGLWFIPVILIPSIWPAYAISVGEFGNWWDAIMRQTHRESRPLFDSIVAIFKIDPVLAVLGISGIIFSAIRKDIFALLWTIPFLFFLYFIGFVSVYHLIMLLPIFCISTSNTILKISNKIRNKKRFRTLVPFAIIFLIAVFGLVSTTMLITTTTTTNRNLSYFEAIAFIVDYLPDNNNKNKMDNSNKVTVISNPIYLWIPQYIFDTNHQYKDFYDKGSMTTEKILLIVDRDFKKIMSGNNKDAEWTKGLYDDTTNTIAFIISGKIDYPKFDRVHDSDTISENTVSEIIEIRTNHVD
jgi:Dolichyl-phosphate-mannose-protein mannosyltransferase